MLGKAHISVLALVALPLPSEPSWAELQRIWPGSSPEPWVDPVEGPQGLAMPAVS